MSNTLKILLALLGGLACGAVLRLTGGALLPVAQGIADPVGGLWLSALRMGIVPLVFALAAEAADPKPRLGDPFPRLARSPRPFIDRQI